MKPKPTKSHDSKPTKHAKETTMNPSTKTHASKTKTHSQEETMTTQSDPTPATASPAPATAPQPTTAPAASTNGATPTPAASPAASSDNPKAPPKIVLPAVPAGTPIAPARDIRIMLPKREELNLIPQAETEIRTFPDFSGVFGKVTPSQTTINQTLDTAYQWTTLRIGLAAWLKYAKAQEAPAWVSARAVLARLTPAFALAVTTDATIGERNSALAALLKTRSVIAQRGATTRMADKKAKANGELPLAGAAGAKQRKKDEKAAFEAEQATTATSTSSSAPAPAPVVSSATAPAASTAPAAGAPVSPVAAAAPAPHS